MALSKELNHTLVIGYGNLDRADDGVGYYVINALRTRLGQQTLSEGDTGLEELGREMDSIFLSQLAPELMETMTDYRQVIFVDAHVYENVESLYCVPIVPEYGPSTFSHHMSPEIILALLKSLYHHEPAGYLVSIRGYDFDFHRNLSAETKALVEKAVDYILQKEKMGPL